MQRKANRPGWVWSRKLGMLLLTFLQSDWYLRIFDSIIIMPLDRARRLTERAGSIFDFKNAEQINIAATYSVL